MLAPRIIPSLLVHNKGLVKTVKFKDAKYVGDPINAVKIFNEKEADNNLKRDEKNANNYEIEKILNEQLKIKDKQLAEKDKQIQTMQKLLDQQQQLSLQSNKQIEKLQLQLSNESVEDLIHSTSNQLVNDKDENSETISANKSFFSRIFKKQSN